MKIKVQRIIKTDKYTIGRLSINDEYFCDTLEDTDRGLTQNDTAEEIATKKIYGETAIPTGTYTVDLDTVSPRFEHSKLYESIGGKLPRLQGVKGFQGVLIHVGNYTKDTEGCILVGDGVRDGVLLNSRLTFNRLYERLLQAKEEISIEII